MTIRLLVVLAVSLLTVPVFAQLTVGVLPDNLNSSDANFPTPQTDVSLENPVGAAGVIDTVTFGWNATCSGVAKIKFFRRSGTTLTMTEQRGPFNTFVSGRVQQTVTLSPPVAVQAGDLIAITRVVACGNALAEAGTGTQGYVVLQGDAASGTISAANTYHDRLGLQGTGTADLTPSNVGTLAVAGSTAGGFGSNFKTSVQMLNPTNSAITGKLVYHRAGTQASAADHAQPFSFGPGEILSFTDVVASMGDSGLGSIDISTTSGQPLPLVVARIYNDAGTGGTAGFFEDVIPQSPSGPGTHVLTAGTRAYLLTPLDITRTRLNIGVRSLSSGATFNAFVEDSAGHVLTGINKVFLPDFFQQVDSTSFFGVPIGSNVKIRIEVSNGSAIIYGATTDNITNDPSVQFATALAVSP